MAALIVQSRFAGLKIEDDDSPATSGANNKKGRPSTAQAATAKKPDAAKKAKSSTNGTKTQTASKKKKSKPAAMRADQWEQWKQKDEQLVDGNYEDELQQAILLSKLDYEEKKDVYKQVKKVAEAEKKTVEQPAPGKEGKKKQKKKNVMSLDQFNGLVSGEEPKPENQEDVPEETKSPDKDTEFFERIKDDFKNELLKDKIKERVRKQHTQPDDVITRVQFADALERKDKEISALKEHVAALQQDLINTKTRNKKLCHILGQGEMKDKAQVIIEVERLRAEQTELTAELAELHSRLEKERSKNDPRAKDKFQKKKAAHGDKEK